MINTFLFELHWSLCYCTKTKITFVFVTSDITLVIFTLVEQIWVAKTVNRLKIMDLQYSFFSKLGLNLCRFFCFGNA